MGINGHIILCEDYVSFETAKLLKEKGFNCEKQYISAMYDEDGNFCSLLTTSELGGYDYEDFDDKDFIAPTLQMAMKWLREVHKIIPIILTGEYSQKPLYYWFRIDAIIEGRLKDAIYREDVKEFSSYEQACEAAIKYCLENLI